MLISMSRHVVTDHYGKLLYFITSVVSSKLDDYCRHEIISNHNQSNFRSYNLQPINMDLQVIFVDTQAISINQPGIVVE